MEPTDRHGKMDSQEIEVTSTANVEMKKDDEVLENNEVSTTVVPDEASAVEKDKENKMLQAVPLEGRNTLDAKVQGRTADDKEDTETAVPNKSKLIQAIVEPVKADVNKEAEKSAECEEIGNNEGSEDSSILDEINLTVNIELKSKLEDNVRVIKLKDCTKHVEPMEVHRELKLMINRMLERLDETMASSKSINSNVEEKKEIDSQSEESMESGQNIEPMDTKEQKILKDKWGVGFTYSFYVDSSPVISFGKMRKIDKLMKRTNTTLTISKCIRKHIVIRGEDEELVRTAELETKRILGLENTSRHINHVLSLPMNVDEVIKNVNTFKEDVLNNCAKDASGVSAKLFQSPCKLHLTIAVLALFNEHERNEAIDALNYCKKEIVDPILKESGPIVVELKGVSCMNDQPDQAKVIYVNVSDETGRLQKMGNLIYRHFLKLESVVNKEKHLMKKVEEESVFFHLTVMNVKYVNMKLNRHKHLKSFDATNIIRAHQDTFFGKFPITSIHLSRLGSSNNSDSYYKALASVPLDLAVP